MKYKNTWFVYTFGVLICLSCAVATDGSEPGITAITIPSADDDFIVFDQVMFVAYIKLFGGQGLLDRFHRPAPSGPETAK